MNEMNDRPGLERTLTTWLEQQAPQTEPAGLVERVTADVARARPLPGWVLLERWLPMQTRARYGTAARAVTIMAVLGLLLAAFAAIGVGSQPDTEPAPPYGLARNGLIAFDSGGDIWVADPDGSDPRLFVSGPGFDIDPTFSPDGTKLAFWSLEVGEDSPIDLDDPSITTMTALFAAGTASLMVSELDGATVSEPQALVTGLRLHMNGDPPSWSPTSDALAYGHLVDPKHLDDPNAKFIDTIAMDGGEPRRVAAGDGPSWSPDGDRLAFRTATDPHGLMVAGVDGSDPRQVSFTSAEDQSNAFERPQWSPDGQTVAFSVPDVHDGFDIKTVTFDGSAESFVSDAVASEYWPYWSPDGTRLAFQREERGASHLVVAEALDGWAPTELSSQPLSNKAPVVWSPDGTRLIGFPVSQSTLGGGGGSNGVAILDASGPGADEPLIIDASSPWFSASWQRLAP